MTRMLAFEWDAAEARLAVARIAGGVQVEAALAIPLRGGESSGAAGIGAKIAAALAERGIARGDALVALARGKVELRRLQLPPVPDDELPDLVRFQALRQFPGLGDDWPLDFVKLDGEPRGEDQQLTVLAATASPDAMAEVRRVCDACQLPASRLELRPLASVALAARSGRSSGCRLLVELLAEEAELTVMVDRDAVVLRTVRIPEHDPAAAIVAEIRRTLAAAKGQLGGREIDAVTLLGSDSETAALRTTLAAELGKPVDVLDPFSCVDVSGSVAASLPAQRARFAAVLGMLCIQAAEQSPAVDFLHPRRRPVPPNRRFRYAVIAAGVAAILLLGVVGFWWRLSNYDKQIRLRGSESADLNKPVEMAKKLEAEVAEIDEFVLGDVNWLDELVELSREFPPPDEAIVQQATFSSLAKGGGQMILDGHVIDPAVLERMEAGLRDKRHQVTGTGTRFDERQPDLQWVFQERIVVLPKAVEDLVVGDDEAEGESGSGGGEEKGSGVERSAKPPVETQAELKTATNDAAKGKAND